MPATAIKATEQRRSALRRYDILDTPREDEFDEIVSFVAEVCKTPIALVSLLDADRQWFKAETGLDRSETPLSQSICVHAVREGGFVEIEDTLASPLSRDSALCHGAEAIRFYAGAPLVAPDGHRLGMLCVADHRPRHLDPLQRRTIEVMAVQVMRLMELRAALARVDVLRREIDHRVKNSLASIAAVVRMQAARTGSSQVRAALGEVQGRLAAQSALHIQLMKGDDGERADLAGYLAELAEPLRSLLPDGAAFEVTVEPVLLASEQLGRIGLIVNEFVTNAAKYGFGSGQCGMVTITGRRQGDAGYRLTCTDDGCADEAALAAAREGKGLGTRIIAAAAVSLGGDAEWSLADPGLRLSLHLDG